MNGLRSELAIADTAKIAYINALSKELEQSNTKPTSDATSKTKKKKVEEMRDFSMHLKT